MASRTTTPAPAATGCPTSTWTRSTRPGIGARTTPPWDWRLRLPRPGSGCAGSARPAPPPPGAPPGRSTDQRPGPGARAARAAGRPSIRSWRSGVPGSGRWCTTTVRAVHRDPSPSTTTSTSRLAHASRSTSCALQDRDGLDVRRLGKEVEGPQGGQPPRLAAGRGGRARAWPDRRRCTRAAAPARRAMASIDARVHPGARRVGDHEVGRPAACRRHPPPARRAPQPVGRPAAAPRPAAPRARPTPRSRPWRPRSSSSAAGLADAGVEVPAVPAAHVAQRGRPPRRAPGRPSRDAPARTPSAGKASLAPATARGAPPSGCHQTARRRTPRRDSAATQPARAGARPRRRRAPATWRAAVAVEPQDRAARAAVGSSAPQRAQHASTAPSAPDRR